MRRYLPIVTILFMVASCSRSEVPPWSIEIRDGIEVRVYSSSDPPSIDPFRLGDSTLFGTDQSADTYLWRYAAPALELPDGNLLIADGRSDTGVLHRFSQDGRFLSSFGRTGEGPGELLTVQKVFVVGDTLGISDSGNKRMSFFDFSGRYLGQRRMPTETAGHIIFEIMPLNREHFMLVSLDGRGLSQTDTETVFRWSFLVQALDQDLMPVNTLVDSLYEHVWHTVDNKYLYAPMARDAPVTYAVAPRLPVAWVESNDYRVEFMDVGNGKRYAVELPHDPVPVTADMRSRFIDIHVQQGYSREGLNRLQLPARLPAIGLLLWDDEGRLWVRDFVSDYANPETEGYHFNVFSRDGVWLFRQYLLKTPRLIGQGGIYVTDEDEAGNPLVRRIRLVDGRSP